MKHSKPIQTVHLMSGCHPGEPEMVQLSQRPRLSKFMFGAAVNPCLNHIMFVRLGSGQAKCVWYLSESA